MKKLLFLFVAWLSINGHAQSITDSVVLRRSLDSATATLRDAFAKGGVSLVARLHHPNVVKYFGGNNVVTGRDALEKGLKDWFKNSTVEFVENTVESTAFNGETAIQTCIFAIKNTPKNGGQSVISRGRSMVIYIRDSSSPTGWLTLREMTQAAPDK